MKEGKVQGILYLPHDLRNGCSGEMKPYFPFMQLLMPSCIRSFARCFFTCHVAINDKYRPDEAVFLPPQGLLAVAMAKPINVEGTALYNYTEGYGSYLIPAVMMIIIFQTLLMVIAW